MTLAVGAEPSLLADDGAKAEEVREGCLGGRAGSSLTVSSPAYLSGKDGGVFRCNMF